MKAPPKPEPAGSKFRRDLSIADVGAMGVPFMKDETERKRAMLKMTGVTVVQVTFMIYMSAYVVDNSFPGRKDVPWAKLPLLAAALIAHGLQSLVDVCKGWRVVSVANDTWWYETVGEEGEPVEIETEEEKGLTSCVGWTLIIVDGFILPFINYIVGSFWLCTSTDIKDLVLDATAVYFVSQLDDFVVNSIVHSNMGPNTSIKHKPQVYNDHLWQMGTVVVFMAAVVMMIPGVYINHH